MAIHSLAGAFIKEKCRLKSSQEFVSKSNEEKIGSLAVDSKLQMVMAFD